jgi:hypothetical protein
MFEMVFAGHLQYQYLVSMRVLVPGYLFSFCKNEVIGISKK